jgi:hypothetical protein
MGLALVVIAVRLPAQGKVDGWTMAMRSTADSEGVTSRMPTISHLYVTDHQVRSERKQEKLGNLDPRVDFPIQVTDDTARTTTSIFTNQRRATVSKTDRPLKLALDDSAGQFLTGPVMTTRDLGPGGTILGHPTRKYGIALTYVARTTFDGLPCRRTTNMSGEIWAARDIDDDARLRAFFDNARTQAVVSHGPVADSIGKLRVHQYRLINGLVLRSIITSKRADATGTVRTMKSTMEVTELSRGPLARSLFQIPAEFKTTKFPPVDRPFRTSAESVQFAKIRAGADASVKASLRRALCDM